MKKPIRVLIVDNQSLVRLGVRSILNREQDILVVGEADCGVDAVQRAAWQQADIVVMDTMLADGTGQETIRRIRQQSPLCQVVVLTEYCDESSVRAAIQAGAIGYLMKDVLVPDLVLAIRSAARGEPSLTSAAQAILMRQSTVRNRELRDLTEREIEILRLLGKGLRNRDIANTLHLTEGTVKGYVSIILSKLEVRDRTQAALFAVNHGLAAA